MMVWLHFHAFFLQKKYYRPKYLQDVPEYAELFYTKEPMRVSASFEEKKKSDPFWLFFNS